MSTFPKLTRPPAPKPTPTRWRPQTFIGAAAPATTGLKPPFEGGTQLSNGVVIAEIVVTPELADEWLRTRNMRNRFISPDYVDQYARAMREGHWDGVGIGPGILFGPNGELFDGQHRLLAVARSGVAQRFLVRYGAHDDLRQYIDKGRARNVTTDIALLGEPGAQYVVAATAMILMLVSGRTHGHGLRLMADDILFVKGLYPSFDEFISICRRKTGERVFRQSCFYGALVYASGMFPEQALGFFHQTITGVGIDVGSPILLLRRLLMNVPATKDRRLMLETARKVLRAFQFWKEGRSVRTLYASTYEAGEFVGEIDPKIRERFGFTEEEVKEEAENRTTGK